MGMYLLKRGLLVMNSYIGKLYPATKFWLLCVIVFLCMFTPGYILQYSMLGLILVLSFLSCTTKQFIATFLKSIFMIVIFIFVVQVYLINNQDSVSLWWFIKYSQSGLQNSLLITSKIVGISSAIIYFFQVTSVKDINYGLEKAGINKKITYVIIATIQLIPQMMMLSHTITDAQKARGIETQGSVIVRLKAFLPMIGPLVLTSIQQTEEKVLTLESRGFSSIKNKSSIYSVQRKPIDYFLVVLCVVILFGFISWRFF